MAARLGFPSPAAAQAAQVLALGSQAAWTRSPACPLRWLVWLAQHAPPLLEASVWAPFVSRSQPWMAALVEVPPRRGALLSLRQQPGRGPLASLARQRLPVAVGSPLLVSAERQEWLVVLEISLSRCLLFEARWQRGQPRPGRSLAALGR